MFKLIFIYLAITAILYFMKTEDNSEFDSSVLKDSAKWPVNFVKYIIEKFK